MTQEQKEDKKKREEEEAAFNAFQEETKKKQVRLQEISKKKEEARLARIKEQNTPMGKAAAWLKGTTAILTGLHGIEIELHELDADVALVYRQKFETHRTSILEIRDAIDAALKGSAGAKVAEKLAEAQNATTQYKSDRDAASTLIRSVKKAEEAKGQEKRQRHRRMCGAVHVYFWRSVRWVPSLVFL